MDTDLNEEHTAESSREHEKTSINIDANDLDEDTIEKLRGDTIGDTLFSQSFVLKTLLKFSDLEWNDQVEEDLCFLWDMTVEKDVCTFLLDMSFPSITCSAVLQHDENNRFLEIVIGILANIYSAGCDNVMSKEELDIILSISHSDDPLILIQLMRFISASADSSNLLFILVNKSLLQQMCFILKSSTNSDLLLKTLEAMAKLTTGHKISDHLIHFNIYESIMMSYKTMTKTEYGHFEPDTKDKLLCIKYMLENITNICAYIDKCNKRGLLINIQSNSNVFAHEIMKILDFFSQEGNLIPITDYFIFYMSAITYISVIIGLKYIPELFLSVTKILEHIIDIKDEVEELFDSTLELECHLISNARQENILKDLKLLSRQKVKKVLNVIHENSSKYGLSGHIIDCLLKYYKEL